MYNYHLNAIKKGIQTPKIITSRLTAVIDSWQRGAIEKGEYIELLSLIYNRLTDIKSRPYLYKK